MDTYRCPSLGTAASEVPQKLTVINSVNSSERGTRCVLPLFFYTTATRLVVFEKN